MQKYFFWFFVTYYCIMKYFYDFDYILLNFVTYTTLLQIWFCKKLRTFWGIFFFSNLVCVKTVTFRKSDPLPFFKSLGRDLKKIYSADSQMSHFRKKRIFLHILWISVLPPPPFYPHWLIL